MTSRQACRTATPPTPKQPPGSTRRISEHALGVITGEVGAGKTVALRAALASLDPSRHTLIYLGNPSVGVRGINHAIVAALGGVPKTHHATLTPQAMDLLAREHAERGRIPVLAIDEAHMLEPGQLEAVRMLTNHDLDSGCPLACRSSASPPCGGGSSSASSPPSTSASPSATPCPA